MSRNGLPSGGGSGRGGGGANEYFVDPKLVFRIKQFVGEHHERGSMPTEDAAVDYLLDKFKEYVRKPQVCACVDFHGHLLVRSLDGTKHTVNLNGRALLYPVQHGTWSRSKLWTHRLADMCGGKPPTAR